MKKLLAAVHCREEEVPTHVIIDVRPSLLSSAFERAEEVLKDEGVMSVNLWSHRTGTNGIWFQPDTSDEDVFGLICEMGDKGFMVIDLDDRISLVDSLADVDRLGEVFHVDLEVVEIASGPTVQFVAFLSDTDVRMSTVEILLEDLIGREV